MCHLKLTQEARHRCAERAQAMVDDYISGRACHPFVCAKWGKAVFFSGKVVGGAPTCATK